MKRADVLCLVEAGAARLVQHLRYAALLCLHRLREHRPHSRQPRRPGGDAVDIAFRRRVAHSRVAYRRRPAGAAARPARPPHHALAQRVWRRRGVGRSGVAAARQDLHTPVSGRACRSPLRGARGHLNKLRANGAAWNENSHALRPRRASACAVSSATCSEQHEADAELARHAGGFSHRCLRQVPRASAAGSRRSACAARPPARPPGARSS